MNDVEICILSFANKFLFKNLMEVNKLFYNYCSEGNLSLFIK